MTPIPLMAHLVLGYPTLEISLQTARKYAASGIQILELQIPFSHPTADGPVITAACQEATRQNVSVQDCIDGIRQLKAQFPEQEIIVMSYLNRIYSFGFQSFVNEMESVGVRHLIVPDLPPDLGNSFFARTSKIKLVPVLAANTTEKRLDQLMRLDFDFYYLMSDYKITGSGFSLHPNLKSIIQKIRQYAAQQEKNTRIGIGFGISTPEQASFVCREADLAIIGSALIQAQNEGKLEEYLESLQRTFNPH